MGSDVRISGIKVGSVAARALDPQTYAAIVTMTIDDGVSLPDDTIASIANEGPLGGRYVRLEPGTSATALASGGVIKERGIVPWKIRSARSYFSRRQAGEDPKSSTPADQDE